ncbi:MAG: thiamine pyrophosphate-binding protein [Armatimonadota bacterium]
MPVVDGGRTIVETLRREGVGAVFSLPGSSLLPMYDAMRDLGEPALIVARHEQGATHMADGYARAGRRTGLSMVTKAQGATNAVNATFVAYMESVPLVVLAGHGSADTVHRDGFGELDLHAVFAPITKLRLDVPSAARIPELVHRACRASRSGRPRPVLLTVPLAVQKAQAPAQVWIDGSVAPPEPSRGVVREAVELLAGAQRPVVLAGGGVLWAEGTADLIVLADATGIPVVATFRRQDVFPNDHPLYLGVANGHGISEATDEVLSKADVVLALGARFSEHSTRGYRYFQPPARLIHVNIDPAELNKIYPATLAIHADARATIRALLEACVAVPAAVRERWRARARELRGGLDHELGDGDRGTPADTIRQGDMARVLRRLFPPETILVMDAGDHGLWLDRYFPLTRPGTLVAPATGSTGFGFPAALGARVARPDAPVLCVTGDGGMAMGLGEIETAIRNRLPVVTVVVNNFAFANIRDRQIAEYGGRVFGSEMSNPDFAAVARAFGAHGERVEALDQLQGAVTRSVASGLPAVIDVLVDRHELGPGRQASR